VVFFFRYLIQHSRREHFKPRYNKSNLTSFGTRLTFRENIIISLNEVDSLFSDGPICTENCTTFPWNMQHPQTNWQTSQTGFGACLIINPTIICGCVIDAYLAVSKQKTVTISGNYWVDSLFETQLRQAHTFCYCSCIQEGKHVITHLFAERFLLRLY